jgi:glycosyltransferase 2 family protein
MAIREQGEAAREHGEEPGPADPAPRPAPPTPDPAPHPAEAAAPHPAKPARAPREAGRVRRPADLLSAVLALAVVMVVIGSIRALPAGSTEVADDVSHWVKHIPSLLAFAASVIAGVGCFVFVVAATAELGLNRWRDARNAGVALVAGAVAAIVCRTVWRAEDGALVHAIFHGKNPSTFVIDTAFIAFVVASDLARRSRWSRWCLGLAVALLLTGLAVDTLTPFAVVISLFGGLLIGWLVRWALAAQSVRPSAAELVPWLTGHGVPLGDLSASDRHGHVRLEGALTDGTPVEVHLADRDTRGSGLARRLWSLVRLRPGVVGPIALSSREEIERLALACSLAQRAGVHCPDVLLLDQTPREALVLVLTRPRGDTPDASLTPSETSNLFKALRSLHDAGIAHRDLRARNLCLTADWAGFRSLGAAMPGASALARRIDVAQLLATIARSEAGPAGAVAAMRAGYGPVDEQAVAAVLQPVALAPWGWSAMRDTQGSLAGVRHELLGADAAVPPARLERFRWRTVLTTVALIAAAYLLIGQISKVNLLGTLRTTNPGWFAVAVVGSAITYLAAAENLAAFVPKRLSPVNGFFVQLSTAFVGVAMPPTVGHVAVNARYLHRQGVDEGSIGAAVALSQIVNIVTTVLLLVAFGLLTGSGLSRFKIAPGGDVLIGLAVIVAIIAVLFAVPRTRAKLIGIVWPHLRAAWPRLLEAASQPLRLAASAGANLGLTAAYLLAFMAALWAVGAHPAILPAAVVYLAGNAVGSAAPTPGGLGGVEAVLVAGLTAMGIPAAEAISGVLVFRVATFWLPIPAGWLSYLWLQRRGTL